MKKINKGYLLLVSLIAWLSFNDHMIAQNTKIRGFVDVGMKIQEDKLSFEFGEYDLFITSELNDHISFLGETVFKYAESTHKFEVGVERVIINYNYSGNHSLLIGKQHTPVNYWNESYHHGRVFFPTVGRPLVFESHFIPIHTTGIALHGLNLGKLKFGYTFLVGNGLGSDDINDNDGYKSVTAAIHIKPVDKLQIGASFYSDVFSAGANIHGDIFEEKINQKLLTGSVSYFGSQFEFLAEGTLMNNKTESAGSANSFGSYFYAGVRLEEKWVPYLRVDYLKYEKNDPFLDTNNTTSLLVGLRYEINYLMVIKLEYDHQDRDVLGSINKISAQMAIGF